MSVVPGAPDISVLDAPHAAKKRSLLVPIVVAVVVAAGLSAAGWFFLAPKLLAAQPKAAPAAPPVKVTVPLGPIVVNLPGEARRYLRVGVSLGVPATADGKEIDEHKSQLLDLLISVFSAAAIETLTSDEGKLALKEALLKRMHEDLHLTKVARVYFTEFVIQ
jgi:flagellar basal body-associated protein FliL